MTILIACFLMVMQSPQRPYPDLIDYSKITFQTSLGSMIEEIELLKNHGYEFTEADIIRALHDQDKSTKSAAIDVMTSRHLKANLRTPSVVTALAEAFSDATLQKNELAIDSLARTLAGTDNRDWVNDAIAVLPRMKRASEQISLANTLAWVGRGEGWPIIRTALAGNDSTHIRSALNDIEKFDGLPNPDGGRPINVAAELHQLAASTPDYLMIGSGNSKTPVRAHMEAKAKQIDKAKAERRQ